MSRRRFLGTAIAGLGAATFGFKGLSHALGTPSIKPAGYNSEYAFEILAVKPIGQSTFEQKEAAITQAIEQLKAEVYRSDGISMVKSEQPFDDSLAYGYMDPLDVFYYGRGGFIWRDYNMDMLMDWDNERESGKAVTISFTTDVPLLKAAGPEFALMLPWTISIFSGLYPANTSDYQSDCLYIVAQVPQTFVRLFMRDADNFEAWDGVANMCHQRMRDLVRRAFPADSGWMTGINYGLVKLDETTITEEMEPVYGPLNLDTVGHKACVGKLNDPLPADPQTAITVDNVVEKLVGSIVAGQYLSENEPVQDAFIAYLQGGMTWPQLYGTLKSFALQAWPYGKTILGFTGVRVLDFSSKLAGKLKLIEMCQPFYGHTAMGIGFHHAPALPDTFAVWEENGYVYLKGINIEFLFPYFFHDAITATPDGHPMVPIYSAFPVLLNNEVAVLVNRALGGDYFPITPL